MSAWQYNSSERYTRSSACATKAISERYPSCLALNVSSAWAIKASRFFLGSCSSRAACCSSRVKRRGLVNRTPCGSLGIGRNVSRYGNEKAVRRHFCDSDHKQCLWASTFRTLEVAKTVSGTDSSVCCQTCCRVSMRIVTKRACPGCRWLLADNASSQTWVFTLRAVDRLGKSRAGALWAGEAPTHFTSFTKLAAQPLLVSIPLDVTKNKRSFSISSVYTVVKVLSPYSSGVLIV